MTLFVISEQIVVKSDNKYKIETCKCKTPLVVFVSKSTLNLPILANPSQKQQNWAKPIYNVIFYSFIDVHQNIIRDFEEILTFRKLITIKTKKVPLRS